MKLLTATFTEHSIDKIHFKYYFDVFVSYVGDESGENYVTFL